jgi:hypothetical protein
MVGQGVLIECLESDAVENVLVMGRRSCGVRHPKLSEIIHNDFLDFIRIEDAFIGFNACFWCLGTTSLRTSEADYRRITVDYTLKMAEALSRKCTDLTFCYTSGAGADPTGTSRIMWARVKGEAENGLQKYPFKAAYSLRPGYIHPLKGIKPSFFMYKFSGLFYPVFKALTPGMVSTSVEVGQAMINAALKGYEKPILECRDIVKLAHR